jgi:ACS family hexuronate transporter-like MFS transporter
MIGSIGADVIFIVMAFMHPIAVLILWAMVKKEKPEQKDIDKGVSIYDVG